MIAADRIDLLPGFVGARQRARKLLATSTFLACVAASACTLAYVSQGFGLASAQREVDVQLSQNAAISAQIAELADLEVLQQRLVTQQLALGTLFENEVRWSMVLADLQAVVPRDTWLTGMSASMQDGDGDAIARIEFQGTTFSHPDVADWLQRLDAVPGFDFPYVTISTKTTVEDREVVSFSSSVLVTTDALRSAQPGGVRRR
jgi:Tfp pilus assembly protein PilN